MESCWSSLEVYVFPEELPNKKPGKQEISILQHTVVCTTSQAVFRNSAEMRFLWKDFCFAAVKTRVESVVKSDNGGRYGNGGPKTKPSHGTPCFCPVSVKKSCVFPRLLFLLMLTETTDRKQGSGIVPRNSGISS